MFLGTEMEDNVDHGNSVHRDFGSDASGIAGVRMY